MTEKNTEKVLEDAGISSETAKALLAIAGALNTNSDHTKRIAENTKELLDYFKNKNGFEKDLDILLEKKQKDLLKSISLRVFSIIGAILGLATAIFWWLNHLEIEKVKQLMDTIKLGI